MPNYTVSKFAPPHLACAGGRVVIFWNVIYATFGLWHPIVSSSSGGLSVAISSVLNHSSVQAIHLFSLYKMLAFINYYELAYQNYEGKVSFFSYYLMWNDKFYDLAFKNYF